MIMYEKPIVISNEEISEGVYTLSGDDGDCWTDMLGGSPHESFDGGFHKYNFSIRHSDAVTHIPGRVEITFTLSDVPSKVLSEYPCTYSGTTCTVVIEDPEDLVNFYLLLQPDYITVTGLTVKCYHRTYVQQ